MRKFRHTNYSFMRETQLMLMGVMLLLLASSCNEKMLNDDAPTTIADNVEVIFDWSKVENHQAKSMVLHLYPDEHDMLLYSFNNPTGGTIKTYGGAHTAICYSNNDPYIHLVRNEHSHDEIEIYTDNSAVLIGQGISTRSIPRAPGTENEPLHVTPTMIYGTQDRDVNLKVSGLTQTLTFFPEELVCHYTVEFVDVENLKSSTIQFDASISSLAGGVYPGKMTTTSDAVTQTFTLSPDLEAGSLRSEFLTFGLPAGETLPHKICLYIAMKNRAGNYYTFDVSDQVNNAPDPRNVTIRIPGLKLPDIIADPNPEEGGMSIEIDTWEAYFYDIQV